MKLLTTFLLLGLAYVSAAQTAVQTAANPAGENVAYTFKVESPNHNASNVADDNGVVSPGAAIKNITNQLEQIEGVSEVLYDKATNLISVTAKSSAVIPTRLTFKKLEEHEIHH